MHIIRHRPASFSKEIQQLFENMFDSDNRDNSIIDTSTYIPPVDMKEEDNRFVVFADLPGMEEKDIHVSLENNLLTIKGERENESKVEEKGYTRIERQKGSFYRRFSLPETASGEDIQASYKKGVLEIIIPKQPVSQPRKIEVKKND